MNIFDFDSYFFDFDGLLVNTEDLHYSAYQLMLKKHGFTLPWDFTTYCTNAHKSTEFLGSAIYKEFPELLDINPNWMSLREEKQQIYTSFLMQKKASLMPGVETFIQMLIWKKKELFVVTNSPKNQVDLIKAHLPILEKIPTWLTREDYPNSKPKPDGYLKALSLAKGKRHIGFEDSVKGLQALLETTITPVVILPTRYPEFKKELKDKAKFYSSFEELLATTA